MAAVASDIGSYLPSNCNFEPKPAYCSYPQSDFSLVSHYENYPSNPPPQAYQQSAATGTGYCTSVDVYTLPTLQISSGDTSQVKLALDYSRGAATSGSFNGSEVSSYPTPNKGDQTLYYFSKEEKLARRGSPPDQSHRQLQLFEVTMGSGSSALPASGSKKLSHKQQLKNRRDSAGSSDNGGFESGTPKPVLGVKEKLRYSLDKISLKSPFKWNSSDKLTRSNSSGGSKSKSKNNRRLIDSNTSLLIGDSSKDKKATRNYKPQTEPTSRKKEKNSSASQRKMRTLSAGISENELEFDQRTFSSNHHDYVNLASANHRLMNSRSQTLQHNGMVYGQDNAVESYNGRGLNEYCVMQNSRTYQDTSTLPYHQMWENKDAATRAKGTWKMLKTAKPNQHPVKAGSYPVYTSFLSDSSCALRHEGSLSNNVTDNVFPEEHRKNEPPKLAPVSGKLLLDKKSSNTILRPTAFRPVVSSPTQTSSTSHSPENKTLEVTNTESSPNDLRCGLEDRVTSISTESNISDSGRHSTISIPTAVTIGENFSYSGSEGYESARISSSTTQSAMQEPEYNVDSTPFSPIRVSDDVKISDLETRVKAKQHQVQSMRRNLKDNEKALHDIVYDDNDCASESDVSEVNRKYASQLTSQNRRVSMQLQQNAEQQYRVMHEEQKQLLDTNNELEDRIKSMTDAIDGHVRHSENVTNLRLRLEESEMEIQQKHGEICLLKRQVKEKQTDLTQRSSETVALKTYNRDLLAKLTQRDSQTAALHGCLKKRDQEIAQLERRLAAASTRVPASIVEGLGEAELQNSFNGAMGTGEEEYENQGEVAPFLDTVCDEPSYYTPCSSLVFPEEDQPVAFSLEEREGLLKRLHAAERRSVAQERRFEREKQQWAEDKMRVIKYQKQLQGNYIQMYKRSHALEREVKILTSRLQAVGVNAGIGRRVNENDSRPRDLSYPMEI